ncbi:MAG: TIGR01212 family radical SAM protein [Vampirovibrionales bacterium]|nr:TIGR01212 family radical SAM protein [Vampirovibrionales bacterium]
MPILQTTTDLSAYRQEHYAGKPYRPYSQYLKEKFGFKIYKATLDGGFTCPNRDGTKAIGGCTFCDTTGSSSRAQDRRDSISEQIVKNVEKQRKRFKADKFIAYFQSFTNTYAPTDRLKALYDEAMAAHPDIIGLAISTRPDCVDEEKLSLIASYKAPGRYVSVEYGMQTIHNRSLELVNRAETFEDFIAAYEMTQRFGLDHCVHIILGMPGETHDDMMATADEMARLKVMGVKIHLLCAMEHTPLAKDYLEGRWRPLEQEEYVNLVCDFIERLHPQCVIHRVAGNGHHQHVVAPLWLQRKKEIMSDIEREFARRGTVQGDRCRF